MATFSEILTDIIARVVAMQEQVLPDSTSGEYGSYYEGYRDQWWTNTIDTIPNATQPKTGTDDFLIPVTIRSTLHMKIVEGYTPGGVETDAMYTIIPDVIEHFMARRQFVTAQGGTPPNSLEGELKIAAQSITVQNDELIIPFRISFTLRKQIKFVY
jgi:hypothetical protein